MAEEQDRILELLTKLKTLADNPAATPAEAANATALLQKLQLKHGIETAQLELDRGDPLSGYGHKIHTDHRWESWRSVLLAGVARGHACRAISLRRSRGEFRFDVVGHRDNIEYVLRLYTLLIDLLQEMCKVRWAIHRVANPNDTKRRAYRRAYLLGAADAIASKLLAQFKQTKQNSTALIVIDDKALTVFNELYPDTRPGRPGRTRSTTAYDQGYADGQDVRYRKEVTA